MTWWRAASRAWRRFELRRRRGTSAFAHYLLIGGISSLGHEKLTRFASRRPEDVHVGAGFLRFQISTDALSVVLVPPRLN